MKKGAISIDGTGKVSVTDYSLEIGEVNIVKEIAAQLGIEKDSFHGKEFYGRVSIVVQNLESKPVVENSMNDDAEANNEDHE